MSRALKLLLGLQDPPTKQELEHRDATQLVAIAEQKVALQNVGLRYVQAQDAVDRARIEHAKTIYRLEHIDQILGDVQMEMDATSVQAGIALANAYSEARVAGIDHKRAEIKAKGKLAKTLAKYFPEPVALPAPQHTQESNEWAEDQREQWRFTEQELSNERKIAKYIADAGVSSESELSDEEQRIINESRAKFQRAKQESGY